MRFLTLGVGLLGVGFALAEPANAQQSAPTQDSCIQIIGGGIQITLKNLCARHLYVEYVSSAGDRGSVRISPGLMQDTGVEPAGKTLYVYACEVGFTPKTASGERITETNQAYMCKR